MSDGGTIVFWAELLLYCEDSLQDCLSWDDNSGGLGVSDGLLRGGR